MAHRAHGHKYIFVVGGVMSAVGKGIATAAEGIAAKARINDIGKLERRHRGAAWRRSGGWHDTPVGISS